MNIGAATLCGKQLAEAVVAHVWDTATDKGPLLRREARVDAPRAVLTTLDYVYASLVSRSSRVAIPRTFSRLDERA